MNWNLKLIQTFILVAKKQSFSKAAVDASRTQPAISNQISTLEEQVGFKLFERTSRAVRLTPEGAALLDGAERSIAELTISYMNAKRIADSRSENVRIACLPTLSAGPLAKILHDARIRFPNFNILVRELNNEDLLLAVRAHEVDFGIGVSVPANDCGITVVGDDEMVAVVSEDNPHFGRPALEMADVLNFPLLVLPQATPTILAFESVGSSIGRPLNVVHRFAQPESLIAMAHQGLGIAILPWSYVSQKPVAGHVLRLVSPGLQRQLAIITSNTRVPTKEAIMLSDLSASIISELT